MTTTTTTTTIIINEKKKLNIIFDKLFELMIM
jgi:hypothetical protein